MALLHLILCSLVATSFAFKVGSGIKCKKILTADYMQQCQNEPNTPVVFTDMVVLQINEKEYAFNGKIEFVESVGAPWKLHFQLDTCTSKEDPKSCDKFIKFSVDDICEKLPQENQVWSGFVKQMKLQKNCPLLPKVYDIEDIVIGADSAKYFPVGPGYYKLKIEGFTNSKKLLCVDIAFTISCGK
ncbi:hypothetical protein L9F63_017633 [Diploptera punctata]|uniref:MD-2-related lipid-recognition domain-containing protein n=1 Tax=Diploptera punctata TaxID=6984 RepID=A0AAD7ZYF7_DIPPU|nr:hypothetical protein L9F63_017633 [Diploptera punctata]